MNETIISRNNAFLTSIGIIEGGKAKTITEKGRGLAMALQYNNAEEISNCWRSIITNSEFLQKMVTAVSIREGMEPAALQSHIAYSASEPKSPHVMAGAAAVLEILKVAGLVTEQDGKLVAEATAMHKMSLGSIRAIPKEPLKSAPLFLADTEKKKLNAQTSSQGISIQIQIQCTANEIEGLAPKLRALLKELSKPTDSEEQDPR